ncbi:unnamed protein product [Paramecium sonneborni]|uniref:Uncharacterized protein n=1 Tax=Paramecium sonneborni TaxID=65129 RepID=A0A8S1RVH7_9CILI|nr:unnamed protein product [Paramecium sonneborni]
MFQLLGIAQNVILQIGFYMKINAYHIVEIKLLQIMNECQGFHIQGDQTLIYYNKWLLSPQYVEMDLLFSSKKNVMMAILQSMTVAINFNSNVKKCALSVNNVYVMNATIQVG